MSKIFGQNIDLNNNEALNFRHENQITFPTLTASEPGFTFFHSSNKKFYGWTGTTWLDFSGTNGTGSVIGDFLPLSGGDMSGDIIMFGNDISAAGNITVFNTVSAGGLTASNYTANPTDVVPPSVKGNFYFDNSENTLKQYNGTFWEPLNAGGGGGGDVYLSHNQTFTGYNVFSGGILIDDSLAFVKRVVNIQSLSQGVLYFKTDNTFNFSVGTGSSIHNASFAGADSFTAARVFTLQNKSGTIAHLDDVTGAITSEGTFTPTVTSGGGGITYTGTYSGEYYKVGKLVYYYIFISGLNSSGAGGGTFSISDLPFFAQSGGTAVVGIFDGITSDNFYSITADLTHLINNGSIRFNIQTALDGSLAQLTGPDFTSGQIMVSGTYIATT